MSYDLLTRRRVHPAYLWGGALLVNAAEHPSSPTRLRVHLRCPRGHVDQTEYFLERVLCRDVAEIVSERPATANCPLVLPSPFIPASSQALATCMTSARTWRPAPTSIAPVGICTASATLRRRIGSAPRIDVRTVQACLGHESLATTQKHLEPSEETERQLNRMKLAH